MRKTSILLGGAVGFALALGFAAASSAQESAVKSWGPKHTTYWQSQSTGNPDPGKQFGAPMVQPIQAGPQQQMHYQQPRQRVRGTGMRARPAARMRPRQQQPTQPPGTAPGAPPTDQRTPPPAERGQQPPPDQGMQPPTDRGQQPGTAPK